MTITKTKTEKNNDSPVELEPNPFQFEILELVSKQRSNVKKVEVLQKYRNEGLVAILIWNFDDTAISLLPQGDVPYSRVEDQSAFNDTLSASVDKLNKVKGLSNADEFIRNRATSIRK